MTLTQDIVDFHAHILPGADHGSYSVEETLFQLRSATENGIKRIIATPHFSPSSHTVESFLRRRSEAYKRILPYMSNDMPSVILGAEVLYCDGIERMPGLEQLCVSGTKTLLLELPFSGEGKVTLSSVKKIIGQGIQVVLAHVDRYSPDFIGELLSLGANAQLNATALSGIYIKRSLKAWLRDNRVYALGSDIHNKDKSAYPQFVRASSKLSKYIEFIKRESDKIWDLAVLNS